MADPLLLPARALLAASERAAGSLHHAGVRAGDVVALRLGPTPDAAALLVALWRMGAVAAPLSTRLPEARVADALRLVGARALVTDAFHEAAVALLEPAALRRGAPLPLPAWDDLDLDAPATYVFTSGSTGTPKAAVLTLGHHVWNARGAAVNLPVPSHSAWLLTLPLFHVGGLAILFRVLEAGAAVAFGPPADAFAPGVTHVSLVATQLARLLRGGTAPATLRGVLLGGSAIPSSLLEAAVRRGLPVHTTYGLTEMASQVTTTPAGASRDVLRSSGRLLPHRDLRVVDGEIHVRGRTRFAGYLTPDGLATPFDADGWYATGDLGHVDAEGLLHVTGRRDFLFISGGENIQPEAIERALAEAGVAQSVVVPVSDAEFGQRPVAFVPDEALRDVAALRDALGERLPRFMIPVAFLPLPEANGLKPDRRALARLADEQAGRRNRGTAWEP